MNSYALLLLAMAGVSLMVVCEASTPASQTLNGVPVPNLSTGQLHSARFRALHAAAAPTGPGERWRQIPWQTDLTAARAMAAREHRPLLLWIMDGNPLGCT